jgi:hypothetical protein
MKKFIVIGVAILAVAIVALGVAGYAYAQTPTPPTIPFGPGGRMGGQGGGRMGGMMGVAGQQGPMHEYMLAAMAEALDMTVEDLQAELDAGKTMWQVAEAKGLSLEAFQALMIDARAQALQQAVEAGTLTQEQADWMLSHMQGGGRRGGQGGQGGCPMHGGAGGPGRWNTSPSTPSQPQG